MRFSDTVKRVIELATAIREYWDAELPKRHPKYPLVQPGEDDGPPPPEEAELRDLLASLPRDDVYKLLSIVHLSRGYFATSEFRSQWREAARAYPDRDWVASYFTHHSPIGDELTDGLELLAHSGIDLDAPQPAHA